MSASRRRARLDPKGRRTPTEGPSSPDRSQRIPRWLPLTVVCAVSAAIVLLAFNPAPHSGGDNATYVSLAYSLVKHGTYTELFDPAQLPHTIYPPVFPALLAALMLLGARTWIALKAVAGVSAVATVGVTFLWAEWRLGTWWGLGVALALAFSSSLVYYSHWVLSDITFLCLTVLALYALERADEPADGEESSSARASSRWMALGIGAAGLAYFTRSAGLPLLAALVAWLVLRRRWRALAATAAVWGAPMVLWWLRARAGRQDGYAEEFWLVDPYDPSQGRVGALGLLQRSLANLVAYVVHHIPEGVAGVGAPGAALLGVFVVGGGLAGWSWSVQRRVGPAELFLPLYSGLILLWPEIWSGDRFALPLYPILFLYSARLMKEVRWRRVPAALTGAVACSVLLLAGARSLRSARGEARACTVMARTQGAWSCYPIGIQWFAGAAEWAGAHLPPGSSVMTRKPSIFYVLSGVPSSLFPFVGTADAHLALAEEAGIRYALVDRWDGMAVQYIGAAVRQRPEAFCVVHDFGEGTLLLGILAPAARAPYDGPSGSPTLHRCPAEYQTGGGPADPILSSRIPLLAGL